jgi:tetratricopeptide (TPR) repeat protein
MKIVLRLAMTLACVALLMGSFGCGKLRAKDRLNEGTRAYNKGNYAQAEKLFKESIDSNPNFPQAKLYYAASLRAQYLPGGDSLENKALGEKAIKAYQDVIASSTNARDVDAAHAFIAELYKGLGQDEEHRNWLLKRIQLAGQSDEVRAQTYYTLAVGYWEESYKISQKYLIPRSQPPAYKTPKEWEAGDADKVKEVVLRGLQHMEESLKINPKYANCYSYRGLLYREQGKIETDNKVKLELEDKAAKDVEEFQRLNRDAQVQSQG